MTSEIVSQRCTLRKCGLISLVLACFVLGQIGESFAARYTRGSGSYSTYRSTNNSYRSYKPAAMTPRYTQAPRQLAPSGSRAGSPSRSGGGSTAGASAPRALPKSINPSAPIARSPAFTGRVTKAGVPIIATKGGKSYAVPQQGVLSSRMALLSGASKTSMAAAMGPQKVVDLRQRMTPAALSNAFNAKSLASKIAAGHGYDSHVVKMGNVPPHVKTRDDYAKHIEKVIRTPSEQRRLKNQRVAYWDEASKFVVITNPKDPRKDYGTAFCPDNGYDYFLKELE